MTHMYRWPLVAVISAPNSTSTAERTEGSIRLTDLGDGTVLVRAGWSIEVAADYDLPVPGELSQATHVVLGICSGQAEEFVVVGPDGDWVYTGLRISHQGRDLRSRPGSGVIGVEAVHRIAAWPRRRESGGDGPGG